MVNRIDVEYFRVLWRNNVEVEDMADANLSLILYKGYMKSLENCDEMNKKLLKFKK